MPQRTPDFKGLQQRHAQVDVEVRDIDEDKRTVEIACSSEFTVERWYGTETLLHGSENIRMNRFQDKASVLFNHKRDDLIGVIESARLDSDKVLRATVRFDTSDDAEKRWQQVKNGILRQTSIGYSVHNWEEDKNGNYRITDWEPHEVSFVTVAADPSVGKGRSADDDDFPPHVSPVSIEPQERKVDTMPPETLTKEDVQRQIAEAVEAEQKRSSSIMAAGRQHGQEELAQQYIDQKRSVADFNEELLKRMSQKTPSVDTRTTPNSPPAEVKKQFRNLGEQLQAVQRHQMGIATDDRLREIQGANTVTGEDGGWLVQPEYAAEIIKNLYETGEIISRCSTVPIGSGKNSLIEFYADNFDRNAQPFSGMKTEWYEEGGTSVGSKPQLKRLETKANKLGGHFYVTDELLEDAAAMSALAMEELSSSLVFAAENAILRGDGVGKPIGILNAKTLATVEIAKESGQPNGSLVIENLTKMYAAFYKANNGLGGAVWMINDELFTDLILLRIGDTPVYVPPTGISGSPYGSIFGIPVMFTDHASEKGERADVMLLNFSHYRVAMKEQAITSQSMHVEFLSDQQVFKIKTRLGGQSKWPRPISPRNASSNFKKSPFVVLGARKAA